MNLRHANEPSHAVIAIGSNIAPWQHVTACLRILHQEQIILAWSRFIKTRPIGFVAQPDFINGAVLMVTCMDQVATRRYLRKVEERLGRVRTSNKYGPRSIDLDIIIWNGEVVNNDFYEREFIQTAVRDLLQNAG